MTQRIGFAHKVWKDLQESGRADVYGMDERVKAFITTENFEESEDLRGRVALVDAVSQRDGAMYHATLLVETNSGTFIEFPRIELGKLESLIADAKKEATPR